MSGESRLCIKNVPKFVSEQQLRNHFATRGGIITDVKLLRTPDGTSRQMAFIGFSSKREASNALQHFNDTYLHTSKLQVEWALRAGDESLGRSWSRHSKPSSSNQQQLTEEEEEERFQQYLASVNPSKARQPSSEQQDMEWLKTKKRKTESQSRVPSGDTATVLEHGRLFVRNLSYQCSEDELRHLFSKYGELDECRIAMTSGEDGSQSKGYAFVGFVDPTEALAAYADLDGGIFQGRLIHVMGANSAGDRNHDRGAPAQGGFKAEQLAAQQSHSGKAFNWNSLFVRSDTAAAAMAARLGVSKARLLDHTADGSAAVRLALSEAQIVSENKEFLEQNGVILDAFSSFAPKRSSSVILIKNLPFSSYREELELLFMEYGKLNAVLLTPSKTVALVQFQRSSDAAKAFRSLAYRKYHDTPLFLEWAPDGVFAEQEEPAEDPQQEDTSSKKKKRKADKIQEEEVEEQVVEDQQEEEDYEQSLTKALFVKNLNFRSTDEQLANLFATAGSVVSARIIRKKETGRSLGYGFVEYSTHQDAVNGIKQLQGRVLDGHDLQLSFSQPKESAASAAGAKRKKTKKFGKLSAKLVVRNIPFEASKKELQTLFSSYGQLKSLRLPKKFDKSHRGFCFVEYNSKQEAKAAMDAAGSTHLYGRHLVIEYANEKAL